MSEEKSFKKIEPTAEGWPILELWQKYEDIAMHFNDLLIRLRTQALAGVAALATIIGVFAKSDQNPHISWEMVAFAFGVLSLFWVAIWVIDFRYYNRLLIGAVAALINIETLSKDKCYARPIEISTKIEDAVAGYLPKSPRSCHLGFGRWFFYVIVSLALLGGFAFSLYQTLKT